VTWFIESGHFSMAD